MGSTNIKAAAIHPVRALGHKRLLRFKSLTICWFRLAALSAVGLTTTVGKSPSTRPCAPDNPKIVGAVASDAQGNGAREDLTDSLEGRLSPQAGASQLPALLVRSDRQRAAGNIPEAMQLSEKAVAEIDNSTTPRFAAIALTKLSHLKQDRGMLSEAEPLSRRALRLLGESTGGRDTDYAIAAGNLADILTAEGHYGQAARLMDEALQIYKSRRQTCTRQYADLLAIQAQLSFEQDHFNQAIHALDNELQIRQHIHASAAEFGRLYQNFAVVYEKSGKLRKALQFLEKDRQIWSGSLPAEHPDKVSYMAALLVLRTKTRHYQEAGTLVPFLLAHAAPAFGQDSPGFAVVLSNIGMLYERQKRHAEASQFLSRAYQMNKRTLGPFHPATAFVLDWYGTTLIRLGRTEEGQGLRVQANAALSLVH